MKKTLLSLLLFLAISTLLCGCKKDKDVETKGSIYGVVTDKATGEPIKNAGVKLNPLGLNTVTGSEGQFEFVEVESGSYTLFVTKTGYSDLSSSITVNAGQQAKADLQMEKLPHALRVVDANLHDISELDFGDQENDISRSFVIFNDGVEKLEWDIVITAQWLSVNKTTGSLNAGKQQTLIATVNRALLQNGSNETTMNITSDDGAKDLKVKAIGVSDIETHDATEITKTSALLNGKLVRQVSPQYTEMGFVYGTMPTPSLTNGAINVNCGAAEVGSFSEAISGLEEGTTYYVRAYAKNTTKTVYGVAKSFETNNDPDVLTNIVTEITNTSALLNGKLVRQVSPQYTEMGFVYGTMPTPSLTNGAINVNCGAAEVGIFSEAISGLEESTTYYVRAYAKNSTKTAYGTIKSFETNGVECPYVILSSANLMVQKEDLGCVNRNSAISMCENSTVGGYTDWRLPSQDELMTLYTNRNYIGGFSTSTVSYDKYWNSYYNPDPEYYDYSMINFYNGMILYTNDGSLKYRVRAVRTLNGGGTTTLSVSPTSLSFESSASTKTCSVQSNSSWSVTSSQSWCTVSPSSGSNNGTLSVSVTANTSSSSRTATVTVTAGTKTCTVNVTQSGNGGGTTTLSVSPTSLSFESSASTKTCSVQSNSSWSVTSSQSWCTVSPSSGSNNGTLSVSVTANTSSSSRTATVTVTAGTKTCTVNVTQSGYNGGSSGDEFFEGFENDLPSDWITIDLDGDENNWFVIGEAEGIATHGGTKMMTSASYDNDDGVLTPDNWLISPLVALGSSSEFSFYVCAQDADWPSEHFGVAVLDVDYYYTMVWEGTLTAKNRSNPQPGARGQRTQGNWYRISVDLGEYAGQDMHIAIRHFDCTDMYRINVDDVQLSNSKKDGNTFGNYSTWGKTPIEHSNNNRLHIK